MTRSIALIAIATNTLACGEPPTSTAVADLTVQERVDQILASDEIVFSHDHLRDIPHLQSALAGHVTAMTVELTVDQMKWVDIQDTNHPWPPDPTKCQRDGSGNLLQHEVTTCCSGYQGNDCFVTDTLERSWFDAARADLVNNINSFGGQVQLVNTAADIDSVKAASHLGIIIGTEGALVTCTNASDCPWTGVTAGNGMLANVEALYGLGWRKTQFRHATSNSFTTGSVLTPLGQQLAAALNRRGIVIDTDHLSTTELTNPTDANHPGLFEINNAPLLISHEWQRGMVNTGPTPADGTLMRHVWSGGGHGVIAMNALGSNYIVERETGCINGLCNYVPQECMAPFFNGYRDSPDPQPATLVEFIDRLNCMRVLVGMDHIAIGPDFMPGGDKYAIGGGVRNQVPNLATDPPCTDAGVCNPGTVTDLVTALVTYTDHAGNPVFSDDDIKKILGGNLRDLYQRVWDPTHGYDSGQAHFQLCSDASSDAVCLAAASNYGQGDLHHRPISCQHPSGHQPVGLQISYTGIAPNGHWQFRDLNNNLVTCFGGSTLVASWADGSAPANGHLALYGSAGCDAACQAATTSSGAGTANARALSCGSMSAPGIIALQLAFTSGAWRYYNVFAQLVACAASSTWIANWGSGVTPNAYVRLCDDASGDPNGTGPQACKAAATNNGAGTSQAKALNCLNSTATDPTCSGTSCGAAPTGLGGVALEVAYLVDGLTGTSRWFYYDQAGKAHRCVHGSVLVATTLSN